MIGIEEIQSKEDLFINYDNLTAEEKIFIYYYSFKQKDMKYIENILKKFDSNKTYQDVQRLVEECKKYTREIQNIRNKFTKERKVDNNENFEEFFKWYKNQKSHCGYCGITQQELHTLFTYDDNKTLPLNDNWSKNDRGTLQIERLDNKSNSYNVANLILACPLCNNAKSNLIDENSWREIFVEFMRIYYKKLLGRELKNSQI